LSSQPKDVSSLSQSYVLPWRILQQKNIHPNNNNKIEFVRGGNFTPSIHKEPTIEIKIENFKYLYDKYSIPLEKKIIYLKNKYNSNILGPFNYEELQSMYKDKKYDSNFEFKTIDIYAFAEEDQSNFYSIKNINEENWAEEIVDNPLLEYTELFIKVKELLDGTKKRKIEIKELNEEIEELKAKNIEKDEKIFELTRQLKKLNDDLSLQKQLSQEKEEELSSKKSEINNNEEDKKEEDEKEEIKEKVEIDYKHKIEIKKDEEDEKEVVEEEEKIVIQPKVLDMGEKWEVAGSKRKKKVEKVQEDPKKIVGLPTKKGDIKNNADSLIKMPGSNKGKKNQVSGDELVDMLKPKKKEAPKNDGELSTTEFKEVKGKGKKKNKKQFESTNVSLGFKY
jgi:myosin heavy subunit